MALSRDCTSITNDYQTTDIHTHAHRVLEEGLQALRGQSTHLNEQKFCKATYVQKSMPAEIWASFRGVPILRRLEDLETSVQRISAAKDISVSLDWRIIHEA
jgi:hypothetical protein